MRLLFSWLINSPCRLYFVYDLPLPSDWHIMNNRNSYFTHFFSLYEILKYLTHTISLPPLLNWLSVCLFPISCKRAEPIKLKFLGRFPFIWEHFQAKLIPDSIQAVWGNSFWTKSIKPFSTQGEKISSAFLHILWLTEGK